MKLNAKLTTGWNYKPIESDVLQLHSENLNQHDYLENLTNRILNSKKTVAIYQLEQLFRKSTTGFKPIKQFVAALTNNSDKRNLDCYINVFAYSFLKGAKNFDLLLSFDRNENEEFIKTFKNWSDKITKLENFERFGKCINPDLKDRYLALRKIISRPSARDEIRTLATLLVSGPSTLKEVSEDLGLNYTLSQRTIGVFEDIEVVEKRDKEKYAIAAEALPVVIFCLRETIGLDLLSNLNL